MRTSRTGPVTTTTYTSHGRKLARRTVLLGIAGAVVGAAELGVSVNESRRPATGPSRAALTAEGAMPVLAARTVAQPPSLSTTVPRWAKRWNAPVYDLGDFIRRSPHARFPRRSVMLTIDDGPHPVWTPLYLRLLEKYDVKATFNMIGSQVPSQQTLVRAMASEGHTLANHTWTHDEQLPYRSIADIHAEIARTNDAIERAAHVRPQIFRAPGGVWGPKVFDVLAREEMLPLDWDIDPRDWARPGTVAIEDAMLQAGPGNIILCHDGGGDRSETYAALERVIPALINEGLTFTTLPLGR